MGRRAAASRPAAPTHLDDREPRRESTGALGPGATCLAREFARILVIPLGTVPFGREGPGIVPAVITFEDDRNWRDLREGLQDAPGAIATPTINFPTEKCPRAARIARERGSRPSRPAAREPRTVPRPTDGPHAPLRRPAIVNHGPSNPERFDAHARRHDRASRDAVVLGLLPQLEALARRVGTAAKTEDLAQIGCIAVLEALDHYREEPRADGTRPMFATYTLEAARYAMLWSRYGTDERGRRVRARYKWAVRSLGRDPVPGDRVDGRSWGTTGIARGRLAWSIEDALRSGSGDGVADVLGPHGDPRAVAGDARLLAAEEAHRIERGLAGLDRRDRDVLARLFGLAPYEAAQVGREIETSLGISKARVTMLRRRALDRLRARLAEPDETGGGCAGSPGVPGIPG